MAGVKDTYYVGPGYYGGMSEQDMIKELRVRGPILFDFNANSVFQSYRGGIMKEEGLEILANQFSQSSSSSNLAQTHAKTDSDTSGGALIESDSASELTQEDMGLQWAFLTHSTLIIGYGVEQDGEKFWIVRNSYGPGWGDNGNFKVRRG